jgi:hypothetical protein
MLALPCFLVLQAFVGGGLLLGFGGVKWILAQQSSGRSNTSDTVIDILSVVW